MGSGVEVVWVVVEGHAPPRRAIGAPVRSLLPSSLPYLGVHLVPPPNGGVVVRREQALMRPGEVGRVQAVVGLLLREGDRTGAGRGEAGRTGGGPGAEPAGRGRGGEAGVPAHPAGGGDGRGRDLVRRGGEGRRQARRRQRERERERERQERGRRRRARGANAYPRFGARPAPPRARLCRGPPRRGRDLEHTLPRGRARTPHAPPPQHGSPARWTMTAPRPRRRRHGRRSSGRAAGRPWSGAWCCCAFLNALSVCRACVRAWPCLGSSSGRARAACAGRQRGESAGQNERSGGVRVERGWSATTPFAPPLFSLSRRGAQPQAYSRTRTYTLPPGRTRAHQGSPPQCPRPPPSRWGTTTRSRALSFFCPLSSRAMLARTARSASRRLLAR